MDTKVDLPDRFRRSVRGSRLCQKHRHVVYCFGYPNDLQCFPLLINLAHLLHPLLHNRALAAGRESDDDKQAAPGNNVLDRGRSAERKKPLKGWK
jgi:hypothetical protein